ALVVEVMADPALWLDDTPMEKEQVGIQTVSIEQSHVVELTGPAVDRLGNPVFRGIRVDDATRQGFARGQRENQRKRQTIRPHASFLAKPAPGSNSRSLRRPPPYSCTQA